LPSNAKQHRIDQTCTAPIQPQRYGCIVRRSSEISLSAASAKRACAPLVGIFVNLGLALAKCTAGFFGHSFALIADGLESAADVITGLVVYLGLRIALRPPDENHPTGTEKQSQSRLL
jgi:Co/Zn/Cd efflux system component